MHTCNLLLESSVSVFEFTGPRCSHTPLSGWQQKGCYEHTQRVGLSVGHLICYLSLIRQVLICTLIVGMTPATNIEPSSTHHATIANHVTTALSRKACHAHNVYPTTSSSHVPCPTCAHLEQQLIATSTYISTILSAAHTWDPFQAIGWGWWWPRKAELNALSSVTHTWMLDRAPTRPCTVLVTKRFWYFRQRYKTHTLPWKHLH